MSQSNPYAPTAETMSADPFTTVPQSTELATLGERFLGALIDGVIQLVLIIPFSFGIGFAFAAAVGAEGVQTYQYAIEAAGALVGVGIFLALNGYLLASKGKTIGKVVMKTTIVHRDTEQLLPFWPLIGKRYAWLWACSLIPIVGGIIPLIDALLIFRSNRACLHDDIAKTKVIKDQIRA
ncbi:MULTISPECIES: RDD family protein [Crateriforma]|uniref:RDD family protein n=1 Tax=Crateriforma conspicua TaxID=2527996 RepID=A0A5C6FVP1_9PLAN|nr:MULTISPECIES: RDD family protein [Crateriforma]TWU66491.1 RDD family protein [Crateriforma conspicua]